MDDLKLEVPKWGSFCSWLCVITMVLKHPVFIECQRGNEGGFLQNKKHTYFLRKNTSSQIFDKILKTKKEL